MLKKFYGIHLNLFRIILFFFFRACRILPNVFVNLTPTDKRVIYAKMAHLTYKRRMTKAVRNVSASAKLPAVKAPTFIELKYAMKQRTPRTFKYKH